MLENACQKVLRFNFVFSLSYGLIISALVTWGLRDIEPLLVIPFRTTNPGLATLFAILNVILGFFFGFLRLAYCSWITADAVPIPDYSTLLRMLSFFLALFQITVYVCLAKALARAS
jgi:hypothetical protein